MTVEREPGIQLYAVDMSEPEGSINFWTDLATAGWLDASGANVIETPDLRNLDGWNGDPDSDWGIDTGDSAVPWELTGYRSNRSIADLVDAVGVLKGIAPSGTEEELELTSATIP